METRADASPNWRPARTRPATLTALSRPVCFSKRNKRASLSVRSFVIMNEQFDQIVTVQGKGYIRAFSFVSRLGAEATGAHEHPSIVLRVASVTISYDADPASYLASTFGIVARQGPPGQEIHPDAGLCANVSTHPAWRPQPLKNAGVA
jgi:pterin-4a-carbinolamine dehydratase